MQDLTALKALFLQKAQSSGKGPVRERTILPDGFLYENDSKKKTATFFKNIASLFENIASL